MSAQFGAQLKRWRRSRGKSQMELAMFAGYSQRHLSFLESGRSVPSRNAIVNLSDALAIPIAARNELFVSVGYAPIYRAEPLDGEAFSSAVEALTSILQHHRPFPALLVDRQWNLLLANDSALAFFQVFIDIPADPPPNVMRLSFEQDGLRGYITNWPLLARHFMTRMKLELAENPNYDDLRSIVEEFENDPEISSNQDESELMLTPLPVFPICLRKDDLELELLSMISTFQLPQEITLAELRIETFLPGNEVTRQYLFDLDN